jgi:hypothetical protein
MMLTAFVCYLICGFVFPSILEYVSIPDIRFKGEINNYFLLKPLIAFILDTLEKIKMPLLTLGLVIFSEQSLQVNLALTAMVLATAFPWQQKFQPADNSINMAISAMLLSWWHLLIIPLTYLFMFWRNKSRINWLVIFIVSFLITLWNDDYYLATAVMLIIAIFRQERQITEIKTKRKN